MSEPMLHELRSQIDQLDARLMRLIDERMELALRIKRFKTEVVAPEREKQVLESVARHAQVVSPDFARGLYKSIMAESVRLQSKASVLVGFQGEHGAYGEMAVRTYVPEAVPIPCVEFADVFEGVKAGMYDLGILPVENSIAGAVATVNDLLIGSDLAVVGEVSVPIHHCLAVAPGTDHREVRIVYSHPMALSQCHGFITRNHLEARAFYDTAGAAKMLSHDRPKAAAAIASRFAAELYGLEVLKENIEDHAGNTTRFVAVARERLAQGGDKCSICFSTQHKAGALQEVLALFGEAGINLTRIESIPDRGAPGSFLFLLDLMGSDSDPKVAQSLAKVKERTARYKLLGCFKEGG